MSDLEATPLPLISSAPAVRRDAARNREALLTAAAALVAERGVEAVTMDAIATRAGVGKGTVFRRFGSREGMMASLLDHAETTWQEAVISGPPPLGPGADPWDRLVAFGESRMRTNLTQAALIEAAGQTWATNRAVLGFSTMHLRFLLGRMGVAGDLQYLAMALMAPLTVPALRQLIEHDRRTVDQLAASWTDFARRVVTAAPAPAPAP
ncbi:TetR/AcrR family transcriptional regulator [Nocardioides sambongensis]|uniref:TetR/AcrR family transcriptional regulator n=1 Tax=Nocardioides sambongensis TaxID=2589074 RepID=UPI00112721AA|nr:TetR/AcrR family transcriptional regulator [Nocardioides sambongensis]